MSTAPPTAPPIIAALWFDFWVVAVAVKAEDEVTDDWEEAVDEDVIVDEDRIADEDAITDDGTIVDDGAIVDEVVIFKLPGANVLPTMISKDTVLWTEPFPWDEGTGEDNALFDATAAMEDGPELPTDDLTDERGTKMLVC